MVKQTTQLFIKALIIGLILNFVLNLVPVTTAPPPENASQFDGHQILEAPGDKNLSGAFDEADDQKPANRDNLVTPRP